MGIGVSALCILNLETPSVWVEACRLRLSEYKVMWENQIWASEKYIFQLMNETGHMFTAGIHNSTDWTLILAKQKELYFVAHRRMYVNSDWVQS